MLFSSSPRFNTSSRQAGGALPCLRLHAPILREAGEQRPGDEWEGERHEEASEEHEEAEEDAPKPFEGFELESFANEAAEDADVSGIDGEPIDIAFVENEREEESEATLEGIPFDFTLEEGGVEDDDSQGPVGDVRWNLEVDDLDTSDDETGLDSSFAVDPAALPQLDSEEEESETMPESFSLENLAEPELAELEEQFSVRWQSEEAVRGLVLLEEEEARPAQVLLWGRQLRIVDSAYSDVAAHELPAPALTAALDIPKGKVAKGKLAKGERRIVLGFGTGKLFTFHDNRLLDLSEPAFASRPFRLLAPRGELIALTEAGTCYRSLDGGSTWNAAHQDVSWQRGALLPEANGWLGAGIRAKHLELHRTEGARSQRWSELRDTPEEVRELAIHGEAVAVLLSNGTLLLSKNQGRDFSTVNGLSEPAGLCVGVADGDPKAWVCVEQGTKWVVVEASCSSPRPLIAATLPWDAEDDDVPVVSAMLWCAAHSVLWVASDHGVVALERKRQTSSGG